LTPVGERPVSERREKGGGERLPLALKKRSTGGGKPTVGKEKKKKKRRGEINRTQTTVKKNSRKGGA